MALENKFNIEQFLDLSNYATEERVSRRKNSEINSQEFFTPYSIVKRMCDKVSEEDWADPDKTFLEPAQGNDFLKMKNEEILKENNGKKFDIVLMNPPYNGSLHLKFLKKVIEISDNIISIQPIRWLEDPTVKDKKSSDYNKYNESISKHIKDLEIIDIESAKKYFGGIQSNDLGIYLCDKEGGYDYNILSSNSIIEKIMEYIKENKCIIDSDKKDGWRVRVPLLLGNHGSGDRKPILNHLGKLLYFYNGEKDGKPWYEWYMKNQHSKTTDTITRSIKFNSKEEANNFCKSFNEDFVKYIENFIISDVNIADNKILWMGNAKHPRTGKIGYKSEWTDEDFNKFFELTDEEIEKYHTFISDFENIRKQWFKDHNKEYKPQ